MFPSYADDYLLDLILNPFETTISPFKLRIFKNLLNVLCNYKRIDSNSILVAAKALDTGQPTFASFAIFEKVSLSISGTSPRVTKRIFVIEKPSPTFSILIFASVEILTGL